MARMATMPQEAGYGVADPIVMASIDRRPDGDFLIIADISRDGCWLSVPRADGLDLTEYR